jgi:hypothetical protein
MYSRRRLLSFLGLLAAVLTCLPAMAGEVAEPSSGHKFQTPMTYAGKPYTLLGVGLRKKFVIKVYAMGLYADQAAAQKAFPGPGKLGDGAADFVAGAGFGKLGVLHFLRGVEKDKIAGAYRESLAGALADKSTAGDAEAFLALFDRDMQSGQEIKIHTDESGKITVEIAGQKKDGPQNQRLCKEIWRIWLGPKTISKDMRQGLVSRLDELAK